MHWKEAALWGSCVVGFLIPARYAWDVYTQPSIHPNVATWLMILFMDMLGLWMAYAEGNKKPYMQLAWVGGASLITIAILKREGSWDWGIVETVSLGLCFLAISLWKILGKRGVLLGLTLQSTAVYVSFLPQAMYYWARPEPTTWYLWVGSALGCFLAIYGSQKKDAAHTFIPWASIVLNFGILALVLR